MAIKEIQNFVETFRHLFAQFIITALGLIVALQWQDAIKSTIDFYFPTGSGLLYKFVFAMSITVIAVPLTYSLTKLQRVIPQPVRIIVQEKEK